MPILSKTKLCAEGLLGSIYYLGSSQDIFGPGRIKGMVYFSFLILGVE